MSRTIMCGVNEGSSSLSSSFNPLNKLLKVFIFQKNSPSDIYLCNRSANFGQSYGQNLKRNLIFNWTTNCGQATFHAYRQYNQQLISLRWNGEDSLSRFSLSLERIYLFRCSFRTRIFGALEQKKNSVCRQLSSECFS